MPANTTPSTPSAPRVIDLTPTWEGLLPALIAVIAHGSESSRATAIESLRQVCAAVDEMNERSAAAGRSEFSRRLESTPVDMDPLHTYTVRIEAVKKAALCDLLAQALGHSLSAYEIKASR